MDISVFGLGKVGLTLASCLAAAGHRVVGYDINEQVVAALNDRTLAVNEPGVQDRIGRSSLAHLSATSSFQKAVHESEISFVIVPTPSNTLGGFSVAYVLEACDMIGEALREKSGDHIVALVSTVLPGGSDHLIIPRLEKASGRKVGAGLEYCYNPSFIALGEIVKGIERPDYLLIGESSSAAGEKILAAHRAMVPETTPVARMLPMEAEITKLASNTHETMRVSFANMLLSVCSEIPNANVDRITSALAHRMGQRFFKGAVPYGGPCWPRDNEALSVFMDTIGVPSRMPRNVDLFNAEHGRYILRKILEVAPVGTTVGLIGMAYKPGTDVIERAYAVDLARWRKAERRRVVVWDPLALAEAARVLGDRVSLASDGNDCIDRSDVIVVVNPLKELTSLDWSLTSGKTVIDCWRTLKPEQRAEAGTFIGLGEGIAEDPGTWLARTIGPRIALVSN